MSGWTFPSRNPATGETIGEVPDSDAADLDAAIAAAREAADSAWALDVALRRESLQRLHDALVDDGDSLRALLTAEVGLPVSQIAAHYDDPVARLLEARPSAQPSDRLGVVAVITPFTSPLAVALDAIGPVLAGGGSVVLKPAPDASLVALELARIAASVLPDGVLNVVTTRDVDVAIALTTDRRVDAVHFTGSAVNGERVRVTAAGAGKRVELDVGGVTPVRADTAAAVAVAAAAVCAHAGQGCQLPATLVVPAATYDDLVEVAAQTMSAIGLGDPTDPATICGPVVSPVQRDRVLRYLALAESEGGRFATGGHAVDRDGGWWIAPTVIAGLAPDSRVAREEILGPVLVVVAR